MRPEVATRESGLFWRRTDDEHPSCVLQLSVCSAEVIFVGTMHCASALRKTVHLRLGESCSETFGATLPCECERHLSVARSRCVEHHFSVTRVFFRRRLCLKHCLSIGNRYGLGLAITTPLFRNDPDRETLSLAPPAQQVPGTKAQLWAWRRLG